MEPGSFPLSFLPTLLISTGLTATLGLTITVVRKLLGLGMVGEAERRTGEYRSVWASGDHAWGSSLDAVGGSEKTS